MLHEAGFNGTGMASIDACNRRAERPMVYAPQLQLMSGFGRRVGGTWQVPGHLAYPGDVPYVFHDAFDEYVAEQLDQRVAPMAGDPWLLGCFTDNELPLGRLILDNCLSLAKTDPSHSAARRWLEEQNLSPDAIDDGDREAFRGFVLDTYLRRVVGPLRNALPGHLVLGCRFYGVEKQSQTVFEVAGRHCDVISVNHYGCWTPADDVRRWAEWAGRPITVSEWYAKADDTGMSNTTGAGWTVPTQADRGAFYGHFVLSLIESGACVGWHWFKYLDNDVTDTNAEPSNRNSNKGVVSATYEPYDQLLSAMKSVNHRVYGLAQHFDRAREAARS
ncbi:MAG: hypothetical protein AAGI46_04950 [Planctomycetota bacterium]